MPTNAGRPNSSERDLFVSCDIVGRGLSAREVANEVATAYEGRRSPVPMAFERFDEQPGL